MKALVVYESMYGNTAAVGEAIAASLQAGGLEAEVGPVSTIDPTRAAEVDLLVVGGPTHIHGLSSSKSRQAVASDEKNPFAEPTVAPGLRAWLKQLGPGQSRLAAAFDTRIDKPVIVTGSAAKGIARRLKARDFSLVAQPQSFLVSSDNRLLDDQLEHAAIWGNEVAERASAEADSMARKAHQPVSSN
jgi:hypothetical protein